MCEQCGQINGNSFVHGVEIGIAHLDYLSDYYPGLNHYYVEFEPMEKKVSIDSSGIVSGVGEQPVDKYMRELVEELRSGIRSPGISNKEHISNVFKKFSDRKFQDKSWWGNLNDGEIEDLLSRIRAYYLPHTALLNSGLADAFMFGKFSKLLSENDSLRQARSKMSKLGLSSYDQARIDYTQKFSKIFWDKAIRRETDSAAIKLLQYNRDITTKLLENHNRKSWRSLTTDIYYSIEKDKSIVMRDLERIAITELSASQNNAILVAGYERGEKYFFVRVRPTACKKCKDMYLEDGKPKKFLIKDFINQPRDVNWGKRKGDNIVVQLCPLHPSCFCKIVI